MNLEDVETHVLFTFAQVKIRNTYRFRILLFVMPLFLVTACYEDDSCNQNAVTGVNVTVSNSGDDEDVDLDGLDADNVESWRFIPLDDTVSLVSSESLSYSPGIALDMNDTTIVFLFQIRDSDSTEYLQDTIIFNYIQTDLQLVSVNCGFAPLFQLTGGYWTANVLDSVILNDSYITTDMQTNNVAFYY